MPPPANIVAWYPGDGNANDIIGGNNGTLQGNTTFANGKVLQAFSLDGNGDRVVVGNTAALQLQNFTIENFVRRASPTLVTNDPNAGSPGGTFFAYGFGGYGFLIDQPTGRIGLTQIGMSVVFSTTTITDTSYHHVAVTKSGNQVVFYIDGVADAPVTYNPTFTFTTNPAIGARGDGDLQNAFFGDIDELSIYSRALDAGEIQSIVAADSQGKCKPGALQNLSITFPGSNGFVGINRSITGTVSIPSPAPAGGVQVTLTSLNTGIATVSPVTVTIPQGQTSATFSVTGVALGTTQITAQAFGFNTATGNVTVTNNIVNLAQNVTIAPGQSGQLALSLSTPDDHDFAGRVWSERDSR